MRIGRGPANKSCSSGWVCHVKFYLWGAHPNHWPAGSTPPNGGIGNENRVGASKQKLLLGVGLPCKILFVGAHPNLGPAGSTPPNGGICFDNFVGASKQKLLLEVGLAGKKFFCGGLTSTPGPQGPLHKKGVYALIILWGPANKSCSLGWVCA